MTVTIDKFGRIVIPKYVRSAIGLVAGQQIDITVTEEGFVGIPQKENHAKVIRTKNWFVIKPAEETDSSQMTGKEVFDRLIEKTNEEYIDSILKGLL